MKRKLTDSAVDSVLPEAIYDSVGRKLLDSGERLTSQFLDQLRTQGIYEVYFGTPSLLSSERGDPSGPRERTSSKETAPYQEESVRRVDECFCGAVKALGEFARKAMEGKETCTDELESSLATYLQEAMADCGLVLATCMKPNTSESLSYDTWLAHRSARFSAIAALVSLQMGMPEKECLIVGMAGAIHDVSLFGCHGFFSQSSFRKHPDRSARLLSNTRGVTEELKIIVSQIHEQCDGSGFPRRLARAQIHPHAMLLNVVDAFLAMTNPVEGVIPYNSADTLAYLAYHALEGTFDLDSVRGLLKTEAAYPIGSSVLLTGGRKGTVMRSTGPTYLQPIVQLEGGTIIDLRNSQQKILGPADDLKKSRRITKSTLDQIFWHTHEDLG